MGREWCSEFISLYLLILSIFTVSFSLLSSVNQPTRHIDSINEDPVPYFLQEHDRLPSDAPFRPVYTTSILSFIAVYACFIYTAYARPADKFFANEFTIHGQRHDLAVNFSQLGRWWFKVFGISALTIVTMKFADYRAYFLKSSSWSDANLLLQIYFLFTIDLYVWNAINIRLWKRCDH